MTFFGHFFGPQPDQCDHRSHRWQTFLSLETQTVVCSANNTTPWRRHHECPAGMRGVMSERRSRSGQVRSQIDQPSWKMSTRIERSEDRSREFLKSGRGFWGRSFFMIWCVWCCGSKLCVIAVWAILIDSLWCNHEIKKYFWSCATRAADRCNRSMWDRVTKKK
jgi:hypothetical protein